MPGPGDDRAVQQHDVGAPSDARRPAGRVEGERGHADDQVAVVDERRALRARGQRRVADDGDGARRVAAGVARARGPRGRCSCTGSPSRRTVTDRPAPGCAGPAARDDNRVRACSLRHRRDRLQPRGRPRARQADDLGGRAVLRGRRRQVPEARPRHAAHARAVPGAAPRAAQRVRRELRRAPGVPGVRHRPARRARGLRRRARRRLLHERVGHAVGEGRGGDGAAVRQGARRPPTSTPSCWSCCAPSSAASSTSRSG